MKNSLIIGINNKEENILKQKNFNKKEISLLKQSSDIESELKNTKFFNENFELKNYIGSGSESKVFLIENKRTKRDYILKYLINKIKNKKNENELKISSKLKNTNIISWHGYFTSKENNSECFIMENAKYGNLRNFQVNILKRSCFSESLLCFFAHQILKGLVYCHRNKIAHMDIKPQNIVIDDYLNAKLIDFSISINYSDKKPNDKIKLPFKGTNFYMPLEIINSNVISYKDLNKIDAYSLGVTLFNLAYGFYPYNLEYQDEEDFITISKKINGNLEIINKDNLSSLFVDFITKLLEKDIKKRMSIYEAIQHPWIKGVEILLDEKENTYNVYSLLFNLMADGIKKYNDYIRKGDKNND